MEGGSHKQKNMDKPLDAENNLSVASQQENEDLSRATTGSEILSTQLARKQFSPTVFRRNVAWLTP